MYFLIILEAWSLTLVLAGLVSSEASLLGLELAILSLCPHAVFPLCVFVLISPLYEDTGQTALGVILMAFFKI